MNEIAQSIGAIGAYAVMVCWACALLVALAMPFFLVSVVRNIAKIRRALERIADGSGTSGPTSPGSILHT